MADGLCVGRKDIICFLRPYLGLSPDIRQHGICPEMEKTLSASVLLSLMENHARPNNVRSILERYKELTGKKGLQGKSVILPKYHKTIPFNPLIVLYNIQISR